MLPPHSSIKKFIEDNLENNPTITEMAQVAKMSHYQLDRRMKLTFGLPAGKWLIKTRISQASQKLLETKLSVLDIAFAVGYSDQSAFTKQFKKVTGVSPLKFKKIHLQKQQQ
ncbi:MAG: helix-turn-helix domain-containing protein [Marinicella sp.]